MLITVKLGRIYLPLVAPVGAAMYMVDYTPPTAKVIFGMQKKGESGPQAMARILADRQGYAWCAVAARPEEQAPSAWTGSDFISYDFVNQSGRWTAATEVFAAFLGMIANLRGLPTVAPESMAYNFGPAAAAGRLRKT